MNRKFLELMVKIEKFRNDILWKIFYHFFWQDYEDIDLHNWYYKYSRKLEEIINTEKYSNPMIHGQGCILNNLIDTDERMEFERRHVELDASEYIANDFMVLNVDSGEIIQDCSYANQTTGVYKFYKTKNDRTLKYTRKGNIALVWKGQS